MEERREEKKLLYGRRFSDMDEDRLVKKVMGLLREEMMLLGGGGNISPC